MPAAAPKAKAKAKAKQQRGRDDVPPTAVTAVAPFTLTLDSWVDGEHKTEVLTELDRWLVHTAHQFTLSVGGVSVEIGQRPDAISGSKIGVGACAWDGAFVLAGYAAEKFGKRRAGKCIELGAGPGVPGLVMAKLGWHATLTDKGVAVPMLRDNVARNDLASSCDVVELEWGTREARDAMDLLGTFELVLAADCMYVDQDGKSPSLPHFMAACRKLCCGVCVLTFEDRGFTLREDFMREAHAQFSRVVRIMPDEMAIAEGLRIDHEEIYELYP